MLTGDQPSALTILVQAGAVALLLAAWAVEAWIERRARRRARASEK